MTSVPLVLIIQNLTTAYGEIEDKSISFITKSAFAPTAISHVLKQAAKPVPPLPGLIPALLVEPLVTVIVSPLYHLISPSSVTPELTGFETDGGPTGGNAVPLKFSVKICA